MEIKPGGGVGHGIGMRAFQKLCLRHPKPRGEIADGREID